MISVIFFAYETQIAMAKNPESFEKICLLCSEIFRILYIGRMPGIC